MRRLKVEEEGVAAGKLRNAAVTNSEPRESSAKSLVENDRDASRRRGYWSRGRRGEGGESNEQEEQRES